MHWITLIDLGAAVVFRLEFPRIYVDTTNINIQTSHSSSLGTSDTFDDWMITVSVFGCILIVVLTVLYGRYKKTRNMV